MTEFELVTPNRLLGSSPWKEQPQQASWVSGDAGTNTDCQNIKLLLLGVLLLLLELVCIVSGRTHFRKLMDESFESWY